MDVNTLRTVVTVLGFLCFIGICVWAYSRHASKGFEEAAMLPFSEEDDLPAGHAGGQFKQGRNQNG